MRGRRSDCVRRQERGSRRLDIEHLEDRLAPATLSDNPAGAIILTLDTPGETVTFSALTPTTYSISSTAGPIAANFTNTTASYLGTTLTAGKSIVNISPLRQRWPPSGPPPP